MMKRFALMTVALGMAACGDDADNYSGKYEVVSHTLVDNGCDNAPVPVTEETSCFSCMVETPFFKVKKQSLFGTSFHTIIDCDSATTCEDDGDDPNTIQLGGALFDRSGDGGRIGTVDAASWGGASCNYTGARLSMVLTDDGVKLTRTESRLKSDAPSASLGEDACLDLSDNPPPAAEVECRSIEVVDARLVTGG